MKAWLWGAAVWLIGAGLIGVTAAALAYRAGGKDSEDIPAFLFLGPCLLICLALIAEGIWNGNLRRTRKRPEFIDLSDVTAYRASPPAGRLWFLVLLLAIKDKANEVWLEPEAEECKLRYRVNGVPIDLVPPPRHVVTELITWIQQPVRRWRKRSPVLWLMPFLPSRFPRPPREGALSLHVGETALAAQLMILPTKWGGTVRVRLPDHPLDETQIGPLFRTLRVKEPTPVVDPETGIRHVYQEAGGCVVAALAMLAGMTYIQAETRVPASSIQGWYWLRAMRQALERLTQKKWESVPLGSLSRRLNRIHFPDWPVLVVIFTPSYKWSHCIVIKGRFVHDPSLPCAIPIERYERGDWRVFRIFQPLG